MHQAVFRLRSGSPLGRIQHISTGPTRTPSTMDIQLNLCSLNNLRRVAAPWESRSLVKSSLTSPSLIWEYERPTVWTPVRWNALYTAVPRTPDAPRCVIGLSDQHGGRRWLKPVTRTLFIDMGLIARDQASGGVERHSQAAGLVRVIPHAQRSAARCWMRVDLQVRLTGFPKKPFFDIFTVPAHVEAFIVNHDADESCSKYLAFTPRTSFLEA